MNQQLIADRVAELSSISHFLDNKYKKPCIRLLVSRPRSGLSTVLRHCAQQRQPQEIAAYIDGSRHEANSVFTQFTLALYNTYPGVWERFMRFKELKGRDPRSREIALAASSSIPYLGAPTVSESGSASEPLPLSRYPSAAAELVCEFIASISAEYGVTLFIDEIQELDRSSRQLLQTTIGESYGNLRYVAGYIHRLPTSEDQLRNLTLEMGDIGYSLSIESFEPPDQEFVSCYGKTMGIPVARAEAHAIAAAAQGDIYRIRAAIAASADQTADLNSADLSPLAKTLLGILVIAEQGLRKSDLSTLLATDEAVFTVSDTHFSSECKSLQGLRLLDSTNLPDGDALIYLLASPEVVLEKLEFSKLELLRLRGRLYSYFQRVREWSPRHSTSEILPLLFRLAKHVDSSSVPDRVNELIRISLRMGNLPLAEQFVDRAVTPATEGFLDAQDYVAKTAFYMSSKRYQRVVDLVDQAPEGWRNLRISQVFYAIALNRKRKHDEAEQRLKELCETARSLEELALLVSYRIVGLIHANDVRGGKKLFEEFQGRLEEAQNYGYFLRNGAEVCEPEVAIEILSQAIALHEAREDRFGFATTLCNRGAKRAQYGEPDAGLRDVLASYEVLEVFGHQHLNIVLGNIGHCQLYGDRAETAESSLRKALRLMGSGLPRQYTLLNLAAAIILQGKRDEALIPLEQAISDAYTATVDRVRQKVFHNAAVIHLWAGSPIDRVSEFCTLSLKFPDRRDPAITSATVKRIDRILKEGESSLGSEGFLELYSPCSLLYWYQNPLEGIPRYLLPEETEAQDA